MGKGTGSCQERSALIIEQTPVNVLGEPTEKQIPVLEEIAQWSAQDPNWSVTHSFDDGHFRLFDTNGNVIPWQTVITLLSGLRKRGWLRSTKGDDGETHWWLTEEGIEGLEFFYSE